MDRGLLGPLLLQPAQAAAPAYVAPDLTTPEARRAARKAGVDIERFLAQSQRR